METWNHLVMGPPLRVQEDCSGPWNQFSLFLNAPSYCTSHLLLTALRCTVALQGFGAGSRVFLLYSEKSFCFLCIPKHKMNNIKTTCGSLQFFSLKNIPNLPELILNNKIWVLHTLQRTWWNWSTTYLLLKLCQKKRDHNLGLGTWMS